MTNQHSPETWLEEYGDYLYRYALMRVSNEAVAEDLVQDTFLSAIKAYSSFDGRSAVKTWLVTILKNKIIDHYRRSSRKEIQISTQEDDDADFEENGYWKMQAAPKEWGDHPEEFLHQKEFLEILRRCIALLPQKIASVFTLRQIDGHDSDEICKELDITSSNLWVMLHRARAQLRKCIDKNWFAKEG